MIAMSYDALYNEIEKLRQENNEFKTMFEALQCPESVVIKDSTKNVNMTVPFIDVVLEIELSVGNVYKTVVMRPKAISYLDLRD